MKLSRSVIVFPALALAVTVGYVSTSDAQSGVVTKKSTTTIASKKKRPPSTTSTVVKGGVSQTSSAISVLESISIQNENGRGYSRSLFKHWTDADSDSCNTREEVLIAESRSRAQVDAFGCKVVEGDWFSPYEGATFTSPGGLDVDHVIPLKEAWDSGAWEWTASRRQAFANDLSDPRSLIAVSASQNRSKGDKDPSNWIPPQASYLCTYLSDWVAIKSHWGLSMDQSEAGRIKNLLNRSCASTSVAPWGTSSVPAPSDNAVTEQPVAPSPNAPQSAAPTAEPVVSVVPAAPESVPSITTGQEVKGGTRCKAAEFGQTGTFQGLAYICSNTRKDGSPYAAGYYMWRPA